MPGSASVLWLGTRQRGKGAIRPRILTLLALTNLVSSTPAQEVAILDPGLNAAIRRAHGPGILANTTYIQRVNTAGGKAPSTAGTFVGEVARVPYTADYFFYRSTRH